jgi:hypothetical protein
MLIYLLQALIVSGTIVCVTYYLMRVAAYCVLWLVELSFKPGDDRQRRRPDTLSHVTQDVVGRTTACILYLKKRTMLSMKIPPYLSTSCRFRTSQLMRTLVEDGPNAPEVRHRSEEFVP